MNYSIFLNKAYQQFLLDLGGKKVPTPYRINVPFQPDRRLYGKSDAKQLTQDSKDISQEKGFDLNSIRDMTPVPHNGPKPRKPRRV